MERAQNRRWLFALLVGLAGSAAMLASMSWLPHAAAETATPVDTAIPADTAIPVDTATPVDIALILTKRGLQEHVVDISVNPPKTYLRIVVKNQGSVMATSIAVAQRLPKGMAFAPLSAPALPTTTAGGSPVAVEQAADGHLVIDKLAAGDSLALDVTYDILDKTPGRFVTTAEVASLRGPDGEPAVDTDSTPDSIEGNDEIEDTPGVDADDPQNSHNRISYDETASGQSIPTPNDEDDHDAEVVVVPAVVNVSMFLDPDTATPLAPGQPVTFLVDLRSVGAPAQTIEVGHAVDAAIWEPFALADNVVSSTGGRDVLWTFEESGVTATVVGPLDNGDRDLIPVTLTPLASFSGDAADLSHTVTIDRVNDAAPYKAAFADAVEGGVVDATATAESLDVALRLTVDSDGSDLPPVPQSVIALQIEVTNQGSVPARELRVFSHIDFESWQRFAVADNPPSTTTGDAALPVSWEADDFGAEANIDGALLPGDTVSLVVNLRISDAFTNPFGYLSTEAEISAVTAISAAGTPLVDIDSEPDQFNYDATVDDVIDNRGGDEDDHDTAFVDQRFAVGNQAWIDSDGDGLRSEGEDALIDLELELYNSDADSTATEPIATTVTDEGGMFLFDGVAPGTYVIRVAEAERDAGGVAFGLTPTASTGNAHLDGDNDAFVEASGRIAAGPFVLDDGLPEGESPRAASTTVDALDDLTVDLGFVLPQVAEGSQDSGTTAPPQLAFTGATHQVLTLLGLFLIVAGSVAVRASGRR